MSPRMQRAQQLRAEVSEIAHESFDAALVVKTLGREAAETERFGARAEELRDGLVAVGRVRGLFDPLMEALPNLGTLAVLLIGAGRVADGSTDAGEPGRRSPTCSPCWRCPSAPSAGCSPTCPARWPASTGSPRCSTPPARRRTGPDAAAARHRRRRARRRRRRLHLRRRRRARRSSGVTFDVPAGTHGRRRRARPARASRRWPACWSAWSTPPTARSLLDGVDLRRPARGRGQRRRPPSSPRAPSSSTTPCAATSPSAPRSPTTRSGRRCAWPPPTASSPRCPTGLDTRVGERGATLSGGQRQRLALARAVVRRPRLLVLDDATSAVDPAVEARILDALRDSERPATVVVVAYRQATIALADEVVWLEQGRVLARGTPRASCSPTVPGYAALVRAYSQARGGGVTATAERRRSWPTDRDGGRVRHPAPRPADDAGVPPRPAGRPSPSPWSPPPAGSSCRSPSSRSSTAAWPAATPTSA